ncbi:MAG: hypothetical protein V1913_12130 [Fibrobacterota bacterium]
MLAAITFFAATREASATIRHVGSGQTYTTISAGAAAMVDGDTLYIHNGTYNTASDRGIGFDTKKNLWIIGESMYGTIMDCQNANYAFYISGAATACDSIYFRNFTIKNTRAGAAAISGGGASYLNSHINFAWMKFDHCVNTANPGYGGAIDFNYFYKKNTIDSCYFLACSLTASGTGGALGLTVNGAGTTCTLTVTNSVFKNCYSAGSGGVAGETGDGNPHVFTFKRCKFLGNRAAVYGGAIAAVGGNGGWTLNAGGSAADQCDFIGNTAGTSQQQEYNSSAQTPTSEYCYWNNGVAPANPGDVNITVTNIATTQLAWSYFPQVYTKAAGTNSYNIGTQTNINVTASSVSGTGPWIVQLGTTDLSRTFANDCFTDSLGIQWKITAVDDGADQVTVTNSEYYSSASFAPVTAGGRQATVGRWYNTLNTWQAARAGDLVTDTRKEKGVCYNDGVMDDTLLFTGSTVNASYYFWLTVAAGERHNGTIAGSGFTLNPTASNAVIRSALKYTVIEWLKITGWGASSAAKSAISIEAVKDTVRNCLIYSDVTGNGGVALSASSDTTYINNNIIYNVTGYGIQSGSGSLKINRIYNNTIYGATTYGVYKPTGTEGCYFKNNIVMNSATDISPGSGWTATTGTYCNISSDATATGTGSLTSKTDANLAFISTTAGDFHLLSSSIAVNVGTDLSAGFTRDIDDTIRQYNVWDIGADEIAQFIGQKRHVGAGQTYTTISAGAAALQNGDTLYIHNGTYNTASDRGITISARKKIWIIGESMNNVIMDCQDANYAFYINGTGGVFCDSFYFRNFTIKNGRTAIQYRGGAISGGGSSANNQHINFSNMKFDHCVNTAYSGGAIDFSYLQKTCYVDTCFFSACSANGASGSGGAIFMTSTDTVIARNTIFKNCYAKGSGGAIVFPSVAGAARLILQRCKFLGNRADGYGGAIYGSGNNGAYTVGGSAADQCDFIGNTAANSSQHIYRSTITIAAEYNYWNSGGAPANPADANFAITNSGTTQLPWSYFPQVWTKAAGTNAYNIGTQTSINVSAASVSGTGPWTVQLGTTDLSRTFANDLFTDSLGVQWKVVTVNDGTDQITVTNSEYFSSASFSPVATGSKQATVGRWYSTLQSWETAREGDLVAETRLEKGVCYKDGALTGTLTIDGSTTNASYYMWLTVGPGERHNGTAGTGVVLNPSGTGTVISIADPYTVVAWLEITDWGGGGFNTNAIVMGDAGAVNSTVRYCILHDEVLNNSGSAISISRDGCNIYRNLIYETGTPTMSCGISGSGYVNFNVINNTIYNVVKGIYRDYNGVKGPWYNNIVMGSTTANFTNMASATGGYYLTDDATAPGSNNVTGKTASSQFLSVSGIYDLHLKNGADAIDYGYTAGSPYDVDVDSAGMLNAWDIGADEKPCPTYATAFQAGTHSYTIGTLTPVNVTVASVTGSGPWTIAFSNAPGLSRIFVNDCFTDDVCVQGKWKITSVDTAAKQITVTNSEYSGTPSPSGLNGATVGRWYGTLQAWETARQGDLVTDQRVENGICYNDGVFTSGLTIDGSTANSSYYMWLTVPPGERHTGKAGTGARIRLDAGGTLITVIDPYVKVEWLELDGTHTSGYTHGLQIIYLSSPAENVTASNLIIHDMSYEGITIGDYVSNTKIINCVLYNMFTYDGTGSYGAITISAPGTSENVYIYNTTIYNSGENRSGIGINATYQASWTWDIRNTICARNSGTDFGANLVMAGTTGYNISSDASATGTGSLTGKTDANLKFVSTTGGNFHLKVGSVALNAGTNLSSIFTTDIDDTIRQYGPWDAGADEACNFIPANFLTINVTGVDTAAIAYNMQDSCNQISGDTTGIDSVLIYAHLDSNTLATSYKTLAPSDVNTRAFAEGCPFDSITGLAPGARYFIGVATKSATSDISNSIRIRAQYTRPQNPLHLIAAETPALGDSSVVVKICNINALAGNVDTVRLFYNPTGYVTQALQAAYQAWPRSAFATDTFQVIIPGNIGNLKYYATVSGGIMANPDSTSRFGFIDTRTGAGNGDTVRTGEYGTPVALGIHLQNLSDTSVRFDLTGVQSPFADSIYVFLSLNDSAGIAANYKSLSHFWGRFDTTAGRGPHQIDTLHSGQVYFIGTATRSKNKFWSSTVTIVRVETNVNNPVSVTLSRLNNSQVLVKYGNMTQIATSATTLKMWNRSAGYQADSSLAADTVYTLTQPILIDTLCDTINYAAGFNGQRFYFSVSPGVGTNFGGIRALNEASLIVDNVRPVNALSLGMGRASTDSIYFTIGGTPSADVDSIWIYVNDDPVALRSNFRTSATAFDSFPKAQVSKVASGLSEVTRYYIGVAMRDSLGNWSDTVITASKFTLLNNPLTFTVTESGVSGILNFKFNNVGALSAKVDTLRLYYRTDVWLFDSSSYNPGQLRYSYNLPVIAGNNTVSLPSMLGKTKYFFAVNEKCTTGAATHFGGIHAMNTDTFTTGDYAEPGNLVLNITDSTAASLSFNMVNAASLDPDVKEVFLYYGTDAIALKANYKTTPAWDTLTRAEAVAAGASVISGLTEATKYYVGIAVRDSSNNWSTTCNTDSVRTIINNPLGLSLSVQPSNNQQVRVAFTGIASLSAKITHLRLYYRQNTVMNPSVAADTLLTLALIGDTVRINFPDLTNQRYCFSVSPGLTEDGTPWFAPILAANADTLWVDADEPVNTLGLSVYDTTLTSISFTVTGPWYSFEGTDVDTLYLWCHTDSSILASLFKVYKESTTVHVDSLIKYPATRRPVITGLDTGATYCVGIAPRDIHGNFSSNINIVRVHTSRPPVNPLHLTGSAPLYNLARLNITGVASLGADVDKSKTRVLFSTTGYVTNPYDTTRYRRIDLSATNRDTLVDITGLTKETHYFFSIAVANPRGDYSYITVPANVCTLSTPYAPDTVAPSMAGLTFEVDSASSHVITNLTQLHVTLRGINTLTGRDRDSSVLRVQWSALAPDLNFQGPAASTGYRDYPLDSVTADTLSDLIVGFMPGSIGSAKGRTYYFTFCGRDSSYNWDVVNARRDTGYTAIDTVRPKDTLWQISYSPTDFSVLLVDGYNGFFNRTPIGLRDSVPVIGVWIATDTMTQSRLDANPPAYTVGTPFVSPFQRDTLVHNMRYHIAVSPINTIGNRSRLTDGVNYYRLSVPFDSNTITRPPAALCSLWVRPSTSPESLWVGIRMAAAQYMDPVNSIPVRIDSVTVFYNTGSGTWPADFGDGSRLPFTFSVSSSHLIDSVRIGGFSPATAYSLSAFSINQLSPVFPANRYSDTTARARAATATFGYPDNFVRLNNLFKIGGDIASCSVGVAWNLSDINSIPRRIRFLYKHYNDVNDLPKSWGDTSFAVLQRLGAESGLDTLTYNIRTNTPYIVAAFVQDLNNVWSRDFVWDTLTTPAGADTLRPTQLPIVLTATVLDCRTVRLSWTVDSAQLANVMAVENGQLKLGFSYNNIGTDPYTSPTQSNPYRFVIPTAQVMTLRDTVLYDINPNLDYYFGIATLDTAGNASAAAPPSVKFVRTDVPVPADSDVTVSMSSNLSFTVDWSATLRPDSTRMASDPNIGWVTVVVTDTDFFTGTQPLNNNFIRTGRIFLCSTYVVADKRVTIQSLRLDTATTGYYVTFFAVVEPPNTYSAPVALNNGLPLKYKIDKPLLENIIMKQVSDTLVRVTFIPRDTTESQLHISTRFSVFSGGIGPDLPLPGKALVSAYTHIRLDTLTRDLPCTALVRINRLDTLSSNEYLKFVNSDQSELRLRISLSDMMPVVPGPVQEDLPVYNIQCVVDHRPPLSASTVLSYTRATQVIRATISDTRAGDLARIRWGVRPDSIDRSVAYDSTGKVITLSDTGYNAIYISLTDSFGNRYDTSWQDFNADRTLFRSLYDAARSTTTLYDNGGVSIVVKPSPSSITYFGVWYGAIHVGLDPVPTNVSDYLANGYDKVQLSQYWFLTEEIISRTATNEGVYDKGIDIGIRFDTPYDPSLALYRVHSNGLLEYVGGVPDSATRTLWLRNFIMDSTWNVGNNPLGADANDTFKLVVAKDLREPKFDSAACRIVLSAARDTGRIELRVNDNNVNLDAGIKVFTFTAGQARTLWDTATTALTSGDRRHVIQPFDDTVTCVFDFSDSLRKYKPQVDSSGLYAVLRVADSRRKLFFISHAIAVDSLFGEFNTLNEHWRIVNITGELAANKDFLNNLTAIRQNYDAARMRLYRMGDNAFVQYRAGDPLFEVSPGRSFLMITRYADDAVLRFKTGAAQTPGVRSARGFRLATGGGTGGWKLLALPFMGTVYLSSIAMVSSVNPDTAQYRMPLADRFWRLNDANSFVKIPPTGYLTSVQGYGEGFLVYLYPGDTLNVPVTSDAEFLPLAKLRKEPPASGDWQLTLSVTEPSGGDYFNVFGVARAGASLIPDLMMPEAKVKSGFKTAKGLMAVSRQTNDGAGKIWTFSARNETPIHRVYQIALSDMTAVPSELLVYLDNPGGYSTDLRASGGTYGFDAEAGETREYKIVVGDSAFIKRNVSAPAPALFALAANYPNPFNPITTLRYQVPDFTQGKNLNRTRVTLNLFNIRGQQVAALFDGPARTGRWSVVWNGRSQEGKALASGVYFYRITVTDHRGAIRFTDTRKMVMMK